MNKKNLTNGIVGVGLALLVSACGSASNNGGIVNYVPQPQTGSCPVGYVLGANNACVVGTQSLQNLATACAQYGGVFSSNVCRVQLYSSGAPLLTQDLPNSNYSFYTGLPVKPGDRVSVSMSGAWGSTSTSSKSYLGGLFNVSWSSTSCNDVNVNGANSSGTVGINNSNPVGLMGSDGTQSFFLGSNGSATIANNGVLRLGFNVPYTVSGVCGGFNGTVIITSQ